MLMVEVFDVVGPPLAAAAAAELLVYREVDVVLLYLVAQLVNVEEAHVPSVQAAEISDAVMGEIQCDPSRCSLDLVYVTKVVFLIYAPYAKTQFLL